MQTLLHRLKQTRTLYAIFPIDVCVCWCMKKRNSERERERECLCTVQNTKREKISRKILSECRIKIPKLSLRTTTATEWKTIQSVTEKKGKKTHQKHKKHTHRIASFAPEPQSLSVTMNTQREREIK